MAKWTIPHEVDGDGRFRTPRKRFVPSYLRSHEGAALRRRSMRRSRILVHPAVSVHGLLVRHLVMPGMDEETHEIMSWLGTVSRDTYVNVMDQYYPAWKARTDSRYASIGRRVYPEEMDRAYDAAKGAGLWRLDTRWRQIPRPRPHPRDDSRPVASPHAVGPADRSHRRSP